MRLGFCWLGCSIGVYDIVVNLEVEEAHVYWNRSHWWNETHEWSHELVFNDSGWQLDSWHLLADASRVIHKFDALVVVTSDDLAVVSRDEHILNSSEVNLTGEITLSLGIETLLMVMGNGGVEDIVVLSNVETNLRSELVPQFLDWRVTLGVIDLKHTSSGIVLVVEVGSELCLSFGLSGTVAEVLGDLVVDVLVK